MKQNKLNLLTLLTFGFFVLACTEKVSDDVKETELSPTDRARVTFNDKAIRLVDKNDADLSFMLHRAGTMSAPCELPAPVNGFDADNYDKTSANFTTDCILDVEELDLFFHGAKFELQVDEFLCEYVNYRPYRFYQFQPGASSKTSYTVECDEVCGLESAGNFCGRTFESATFGRSIPSPGLVNITTFEAQFYNPTITDQGVRCQFDYSNRFTDSTIEGPNCDIGSISNYAVKLTANEVDVCDDGVSSVAACAGAGGTVVQEPVCTGTNAQLEITYEGDALCGGETSACLAGSGTDEELEARFSSRIYDNTDLSSFSQDYEYASPISKGINSNIYIANYSRICSSTGEIKTDAGFDNALFNIIGHEVEDMPYNFERKGYTFDSDGDGSSDYRAYGTHPYNVSSFRGSQKPYYAFECLDKAQDVKAQIRLFIREWDRQFDLTDPYIARLSDINQSTPRMDSSGLQAINEEWNDAFDWDNFFEDYDTDNINGKQGMFNNNQCTSASLGYCVVDDNTWTRLPAISHEVECLLPGSCSIAGPANRTDCINAGGGWTNDNQWITESHCTNRTFTNETACTGAGATWINLTDFGLGNRMFPNWRL